MKMFSFYKLHYWPGVTCGWFTFTFIITYLVSVLDGNVYAFFPYISDTGALPPESCIFGLLVNIGAAILAATMYIRYRQVDFAINCKDVDLHRMWNTLSIIFGIIACFGINLVANFQETTASEIHFIGALLAFGIGILYFAVQTKISSSYLHIRNKTCTYGIGIRLLYFRIFLVFWMLPLFLANIICATLSVEQFTGESIVWWTENDGGFQLRLAGSFTEWILVLFIFIYIATFTNEFKSFEYKGIQLVRNLKEVNNPI
ncbi:hypothetical protein ILUMI_08977 [Ignelater luminosus]|uniref:CWH43-like N-terminal domain-containing protein n=1 Tax=Ignelater luminosus TaxID=2038154 RepID=A0A8K0D0P5_IGNLU|nr:hypothetical protein ILUMI_08977 [Ignelater luminosus]